MLVDRETETRDSRRLALRLKAATLRQAATVEDLDFRAPRGLDRSVVLSLAQAGWVAARTICSKCEHTGGWQFRFRGTVAFEPQTVYRSPETGRFVVGKVGILTVHPV